MIRKWKWSSLTDSCSWNQKMSSAMTRHDMSSKCLGAFSKAWIATVPRALGWWTKHDGFSAANSSKQDMRAGSR